MIVDNASSDGSEAILRARLPDVDIIQSGANLGFAGGNNLGIRSALDAGAEYVWLLNNDTEVAPDALTALVAAMQAMPGTGMAGSKIYLFDDRRRLNCVGGLWEKGRLRLRLPGAGQLDRGQFDAPDQRDSISGCSMLVRTSALRDFGMMDEAYFLYWEDVEWCARARQKGYTILYVPGSHVWHKVSASSGKNSLAQHYYSARNGLVFLRRYDPLLLPLFALCHGLSCLKLLAGGDAQPARGFLRGLAGFLRGEQGPMVLR